MLVYNKRKKLYKLYTASKYKELFLLTIIYINVNNSSIFIMFWLLFRLSLELDIKYKKFFV